jgi:uncharacterized protein
MAAHLGVPIKELITNSQLRSKIKATDYVSETVGLPTIKDILSELEKPGRDPRESWGPYEFAEEINSINDLFVEQQLKGMVTNLTAFGAFVDVGVHTNGLVHLSEISIRYVKNAADFLKIGQKVTVWVKKIDTQQNRLELTMIDPKQRI